MSTIYGRQPAFPETKYYDDQPCGVISGMSLREYYAGLVFPVMVTVSGCAQTAAESTVVYVDALLEELRKS